MNQLRIGATAPSVFYILLVLSYASPEPQWRAPWSYPESTTQANPVDIKHMKPEELKEYETILDTVRLIHVACFDEEVYEIIHNIKTDDERDFIVAFYVYKDHDFHYVGSFSANRKIFKAEITNHNHYFVKHFYHLYIGNGRSWVIDKLIMIPHVKADIIEFCDDIHCKCEIDDFDDGFTKKVTNVDASGADFGKVGFESNAAAVCGSKIAINKANEENDININVLNNDKEDSSDKRNQISTANNNLFRYTNPCVCPYINRLMKPHDSNVKNLQNQNISPCTKLSSLLGLKPCKFMSNSYPFSCKSLVPNVGIATPKLNSITKQICPSNSIQKAYPPPQYSKWFNPYLYYATHNIKPNVDRNLYFKQDNYMSNAENSNVICNNAAININRVNDNKNNYLLNKASNSQATLINDNNAAVTSKIEFNGQATATCSVQRNEKDKDSQFIFSDGKVKPLYNDDNNKVTFPGQKENNIIQKPFVIGIDNGIDMFPSESKEIYANKLLSPLPTTQAKYLPSNNLSINKSPNLLLSSISNVYPSKLTYIQNADLIANKNQKLAKDKTGSASKKSISNLIPNTGIVTGIDKQKIEASQLNYGREISEDIRTRYNDYKPLGIAQYPDTVPTIKDNEVKYNDDTALGSAATGYKNQITDGDNRIKTFGAAEYENAEIGSNINLSPGSRRMIATNYKQNVYNPDVLIGYKRNNNDRIRLNNQQNLYAVNNKEPNEVFTYSSPKQRIDVNSLITSPSKLSLSPLNAIMKVLPINGELIKNSMSPKALITFKLPEYKVPNDRTDKTENLNVYKTDAETDSFLNVNNGFISQNMDNPASYYGDRGFPSATYKIPKETNTHVPMNINYKKYIGLNYPNAGTSLNLGQSNSATVIPIEIDALKMYQESYAPERLQQIPSNNFDLNNDPKVSYDEFSSTFPKNPGFNVGGLLSQSAPNIQYNNKATNPSTYDENTQANEAVYKPLDINAEPDVTDALKGNGYPLYLQQNNDLGQDGKYRDEPYTGSVNKESTGNIGLINEHESNTEPAYANPNDAPIYNPQINIDNNNLDTLENNEFLNKTPGKISYVNQPNIKPLSQLNSNEKIERDILTQENKSIDLPNTQKPGQVYQYPDNIRTNSGMENVSDMGLKTNDEASVSVYANGGGYPQHNELDKNINENTTIEAPGFKPGFVNVNDSLKYIKGTNIVIKEKPIYMHVEYTDGNKNDSPTQNQIKYPGAITENNTNQKTFNEIVHSKPIIVSNKLSVNQTNNDEFSNKTPINISLGPSSTDSLNIQTEPYKYTELKIICNEDKQNYSSIKPIQYDVTNIQRDRENVVPNSLSLDEIQPDQSFINRYIDNYKMPAPEINLTPSIGQADKVIGVNNIPNQNYASGDTKPLIFNQIDDRQTTDIDKRESYFVPNSNYKSSCDETKVSESVVPTNLSLDEIQPNDSFINKDIDTTRTIDNHKVSNPERNLTPIFGFEIEADDINNIQNQDYATGGNNPVSYNQDDRQTSNVDKYESYYVPDSNYKLRNNEISVTEINSKFRRTNSNIGAFDSKFNEVSNEMNPLSVNQLEENHLSSSDLPKTEIMAKNKNDETPQIYLNIGENVIYPQITPSQQNLISVGEGISNLPTSSSVNSDQNYNANNNLREETSYNPTPLVIHSGPDKYMNSNLKPTLISNNQPNQSKMNTNPTQEVSASNGNNNDGTTPSYISAPSSTLSSNSDSFPLYKKSISGSTIPSTDIYHINENPTQEFSTSNNNNDGTTPSYTSMPSSKTFSNPDSFPLYKKSILDSTIPSTAQRFSEPIENNDYITSESYTSFLPGSVIPSTDNTPLNSNPTQGFSASNKNIDDGADVQDTGQVTDELKLYQKPNLYTGTNENPTKIYQSTENNNLNSDQDFNANNNLREETTFNPSPLVINSGPDEYMNSNLKPTFSVQSNNKPTQSNMELNPTHKFSAFSENNNDRTNPSYTSVLSSTLSSNTDSFSLHDNSISGRTPPTDDISPNTNPTRGFYASNKNYTDETEFKDTSIVTDELKLYQKRNLYTGTNENPTKLYQPTDCNNLNSDQDFNANNNLREETTFDPTPLVINSGPDKYMNSNLKPTFFISNYQPNQSNMDTNPTQEVSASNDRTSLSCTSAPSSTSSSNSDSFPSYKNSISGSTTPSTDISHINTYSTQGFSESNYNNERNSNSFPSYKNSISDSTLQSKDNIYNNTNAAQICLASIESNNDKTSQSYSSALPATSLSNMDAFPLFTNSISDRETPSPVKIPRSPLNLLKIPSSVSSLLANQQMTHGSSIPSAQSLLTSTSSGNNINPFPSQRLINQPRVPLPQTQSIILNQLRSNLLNYLKSNANILDNAAIGLPLGDIGIAKYDTTEDTRYFTVNTENDDINLKAWYSKLKLIKAKITFETIEGDVLNFMPIVNNNSKYCPVKVQEIAKNAISKVYGEPIVVQGFSFDDPYAVVDVDSACIYNGSYIVLWPTFCYRH